MHKLMEKLKPICEMKDTLVEWAKCEIDGGKEHICTNEMGEVIDMIKDLVYAEEKAIKAHYYKKIIEAMGEQEEEDELLEKMFSNPMICEFLSEKAPEMMDEYEMFSSRMGYPRGSHRGQRRSKTTGRYMPTGTGRMGYDPMKYDENYIRSIMDDYMAKTGRPLMTDIKEHPFDHYKEARRHYTETHSARYKEEMDQAAMEHLGETVVSLKEIWRNADPDMKKRVKQDLTNLMGEMTM